MRVIVDRDLCEANALCVEEAPNVFQMDDEGRMVVAVQRPGPALAEEAREAVRRCPRGALSLVD